MAKCKELINLIEGYTELFLYYSSESSVENYFKICS